MSQTSAQPREIEATSETVPCNICGSERWDVVYESRHHAGGTHRDLTEVYRASGDELLLDQLVRCRECGLEFVNPRVVGETIVQAYAQGSDEAFVSQFESRVQGFAHVLRSIAKHLPAGGRLLDVGTAAGAFLVAARRQGFRPVGIEPNRWLAAWGRREHSVEIHEGTLPAAAFADHSFDVVTVWDVIEHTPDPSAVIAECGRVLGPDGTLVVSFPDRGSVIARALGRRWPFLSSVHLYYFTRRTMRKALERHGFEIVAFRPHLGRLRLGYLLSRTSVISPWLSRMAVRLAETLRISRIEVRYWIGQTLVVARRAARVWGVAVLTGVDDSIMKAVSALL